MTWRSVAIAILAAWTGWAGAGEKRLSFCNPIDLDYGLRGLDGAVHRHAADPVVVLYQDRYWLFTTWDREGYRVSDDLVTWAYVPFAEGTELFGKTHTAAAVTEIEGWLYFTEFGTRQKPAPLYRTKDPAGGAWERVRDLPPYADPCLFVDPPTGRAFMYYGIERPIRGVELERGTFGEVEGTGVQLMAGVTMPIRDGWEVCTWDHAEGSKPGRGNGTFVPCREGAWMTYLGGKYYLQYASPGTTVPGYADGVLIGDSPLGPFEYSQHSPISQKASGFITSAGHGCLFQDRHGNWWRAVTMLVGVRQRMERRVGLFPAGFDTDGVMYTRTDAGEVPIVVPGRRWDAMGDVTAGWNLLGAKGVRASSELAGHGAALAGDEDVRTWWSARSSDEGEWVEVDLGALVDVAAVQVNFAEQDADGSADGPHRFVVEGSADREKWVAMVDRRESGRTSPHAYVELAAPTRVRYVRVTNVSTPAGGTFAVADLRAFGMGRGESPSGVRGVTAGRDAGDRRKVTVRWEPAEGADGYVVRFGIEPGKLYQHHVVRGGGTREVTLHSLNAEPPYCFRVDALNGSGRTEGATVVEAD